MADQLTPAQQAALVTIIEQAKELVVFLTATRYMSVAGVVILVYDLFSCLDTEMRVVWRAPRSASKYLFLVHRYSTLIGVLGILQAFSGLTGDMSVDVCKFLLYCNSIFATLSIGIADGLVTLEVWELWDRNRYAMRFITAAFGITYAGAIGFMIISVMRSAPRVIFVDFVHSCVLNYAPRFTAGVWSCGMVFETIVFVSTLWNVLDRPRASNTKIGSLLVRDGVVFFLSVILLRGINVVISLTVPQNMFFVLITFIWCLVTVSVSRLMLTQFEARWEQRAEARQTGGLTFDAPGVVMETEVVELELRSPALKKKR